MSNSLNKVMLIGRLGGEVKVHEFENGDKIANFSLATSESYIPKGKSEKVEQTEWHRIIARNKLAEICENYLNKGDLIYVEGKIHTNKWDDNGTVKYNTEIIAGQIDFLQTNRKESNGVATDKKSF